MIDESRIGIYNYVYGLLYGVVSDNVYTMSEPQELTESDATDGFIVIHVDELHDESEFHAQAYGWARVYIEAFVPPMSRGRLDRDKYIAFETAITQAINDEMENGTNEHYSIDEDGILSYDSFDGSNANNAYYTYLKSFIVLLNDLPMTTNLYIGYSDGDVQTMSDVESLNGLQTYIKNEPQGEYSISIPMYSHLWICTSRAIQGVEANGFEVPMDEPTMIGTLYCYRSSNAIRDNNMEFQIK